MDHRSRKTFAVLLLAFSFPAHADEPTNLYWGDTHLHTGLSFDAYTFGTVGRPDTAYRYAKGQPVVHPVLQTMTRMERPLDFLIVADHAETLGAVARILEGEAPELANTPAGSFVLNAAGNRTQEELDEVYNGLNAVGSGLENDTGLAIEDLAGLHGEAIRPAWVETIQAADGHNQPGEFTAFIGWEWTSQPGGANFHRVVFMPQASEVASEFLPYSSLESDDPEDLWSWLEMQENAMGAEFLAIPHGPNISAGLMFGSNRRNGEPIDTAFAKTKSQYEPAIEVTQIKGDSEAHPMFSPDDQFADFETYNFLSSPEGLTPEPTTGDYVRSGLRNGLALEAEVGVNPYKMGMVGGTDSHVGIPAIEESSFAGKSGHDALPSKRSGPSGIGSARGWDMGAAGFTAVWAEENTRRSIFEAFRRKEIYASTGPRMRLRFFGGFNLSPEHSDPKQFAENGYAHGVPMGGDISRSSGGNAPSFIVAAMKDPDGANLDRLQIVKGWLNHDGSTSEKVYDVALSDGRSDGHVPVGNTVDLSTARYSNTIGAADLSAFWSDPDFNADQPSFYYARVLEIPTPRYSLYDAIALGIVPDDTGKPSTIQERAYSSPIWYSPDGSLNDHP